VLQARHNQGLVSFPCNFKMAETRTVGRGSRKTVSILEGGKISFIATQSFLRTLEFGLAQSGGKQTTVKERTVQSSHDERRTHQKSNQEKGRQMEGEEGEFKRELAGRVLSKKETVRGKRGKY